MVRLGILVLLLVHANAVYPQDTLFYKNNALPANSFEEALTYGILERDEFDSNQVIETKFTVDRRIVSRTFYKDFKKRIKHGQQMLWNEYSKLAATKQFSNDSLHGYWREYTHQGRLARESLYFRGRLAMDTIFPLDTTDLFPDSQTVIPEYRWMYFMPLFKECENVGNRKRRESCTSVALRKFILENTRRPIGIDEADNEAKVWIGLTINETGNVSKIKVLPETKGSIPFQQEAMRVILSLPEMIPATQYGEIYPFEIKLPVSFGLGYDEDLNGLEFNSLYSFGLGIDMSSREIRNQVILNQMVDRMPIWEGCQFKGFEETQDDCTEYRLERFVNKNVKYPHELRFEKPREVILVTFKVDEQGAIEVLEILERLGGGNELMRRAAEEVVMSLPNFIPAKKDGMPVPFEFTVAVRFKY